MNLQALTALGKRLLIGEGVKLAPQEAVVHLSKAALMGSGEATAILALLAGWGVLRPRDMDEALDRLQRAAELGWAPAQRELRFLARTDGTDWPLMRRAVDLTQWTRSRAMRVVSRSPKICVIDGFLSAAECDWIIERGRHQKRARVYDPHALGQSKVETRTNTESPLTAVNADLVVALVRDRIATSVGIATPFFETSTVLRYEPGQEFGLHADFIDPRTPALVREIVEKGQRVMTFLVYLNDDYEGGETDFPRIGYRFKGRRGDALVFANVEVTGAPDYNTAHAGLPPTSGVKWLLSQWIRERPVGHLERA